MYHKTTAFLSRTASAVTEVEAEEVTCTVLSMDFFNRLQENGQPGLPPMSKTLLRTTRLRQNFVYKN